MKVYNMIFVISRGEKEAYLLSFQETMSYFSDDEMGFWVNRPSLQCNVCAKF